jgi:hypothetical protein
VSVRIAELAENLHDFVTKGQIRLVTLPKSIYKNDPVKVLKKHIDNAVKNGGVLAVEQQFDKRGGYEVEGRTEPYRVSVETSCECTASWLGATMCWHIFAVLLSQAQTLRVPIPKSHLLKYVNKAEAAKAKSPNTRRSTAAKKARKKTRKASGTLR